MLPLLPMKWNLQQKPGEHGNAKRSSRIQSRRKIEEGKALSLVYTDGDWVGFCYISKNGAMENLSPIQV
jgi:hypothetical protein